MSTKHHGNRCKAIAKSGKPCQAAATAGGLCFFHANPKKASELGRIGGRSNRHAAETLDAVPRLETAIDVRNAVSQLFADVHAGKIQARVAASLTPLLGLQLRAIETTDVERRLAKLEQETAANKNSDGSPDTNG